MIDGPIGSCLRSSTKIDIVDDRPIKNFLSSEEIFYGRRSSIDRSINIDPARSRWSPEYRTMRPNFFLNPKFEKKSNFGFGRLEPVKFSPPLSFAMNFLALRVGAAKNYSAVRGVAAPSTVGCCCRPTVQKVRPKCESILRTFCPDRVGSARGSRRRSSPSRDAHPRRLRVKIVENSKKRPF